MNKNLPPSAGDTSSIPGPGRFHMPRSNKASTPQLRSPGFGALKPELRSPGFGALALEPSGQSYGALALEPLGHSYGALALEPSLCSPWATATEACAPGACALQKEEPPQQKRVRGNDKQSPVAAGRASLRAAKKIQPTYISNK